jgi:hypothetical protein
MVIDQRNAGASVTPSSSYTLDRWKADNSQNSKYTVQQNAGSVTPPTGFNNYLGITSSSAYSVLSGDFFFISQFIEGFNTSDLAFGTANAQTVTLSFWVRSSLTGTFGGALRNSASSTRSYPFSYTINSANTWEYKTITIPGDTTGTWDKTNSVGLNVAFSIGMGSTYSSTANVWAAANYASTTGATSVVGTNGATFYITGVQLEKGTQATAFDYRPFGYELSLCQRYYFKMQATSVNAFFGVGFCDSTTSAYGYTYFPVPMRIAPSALEQNGTAADYQVNKSAANIVCNAVPNFAGAELFCARTGVATAGSLTTGDGCALRSAGTSAYLAWSVEL